MKIAVTWNAIMALTWSDRLTMFDPWWNISAYNHKLFVPPIIYWLILSRQEGISGFEPCMWWPGVVIVAGALLASAWPWFDRNTDDLGVDLNVAQRPATFQRLVHSGRDTGVWGVTAAIAASVGAIAMWHHASLAATAPVPQTVALPEVPGWTLRDYDPAEP